MAILSDVDTAEERYVVIVHTQQLKQIDAQLAANLNHDRKQIFANLAKNRESTTKRRNHKISDSELLHPTNPSFPELFLKTLAKGGTISYRLKCLGTAFLLYAIGLFTTRATNTFYQYVNDLTFLATTVAGGLTLCFVVSASKQIDPTIRQLDKTVKHSETKEFERFLKEVNGDGSAVKWYYLLAIGFSVFFAVLGVLGIIGPSWVKFVDPQQRSINLAYYVLWCAVMGYGVGVALYLLRYYSLVINSYSKRFLKPEKINLLDPVNEKSGVKTLGKLALWFNTACTMPTIAILAAIFVSYRRGEELWLLKNLPHAMLVLIYTGILILMFFLPMRQSHHVLIKAKQYRIKSLDNAIQSTFDLRASDDSEALVKLNSILLLRERVEKTPSWPLNLGIFVKFLATVFFPMVGGAVLQLYLEYFLR